MYNCNNISIAIHSSDEDGKDRRIPFQSNQTNYNQTNTSRMYQQHHNQFSINRNDTTNPTMFMQTAASTMGPNHHPSRDNDIMTIDSTVSVVDNCQANEIMDVETLNAALALIQTKNNSRSNANDNQTHVLFHNIYPTFNSFSQFKTTSRLETTIESASLTNMCEASVSHSSEISSVTPQGSFDMSIDSKPTSTMIQDNESTSSYFDNRSNATTSSSSSDVSSETSTTLSQRKKCEYNILTFLELLKTSH